MTELIMSADELYHRTRQYYDERKFTREKWKADAMGPQKVLVVVGAIALSWGMAALIIAGAIRLFTTFF